MAAKVSVSRLGFGVEYFPRYVNRTLRLHSVNVVLLSFILRGHGRHFIEQDEFEEHGGSLAVTHYGQRHDIITDAAGMEILNVYLDLKNHPPPVLPRDLQPVMPQLLPLHPQFVHRQNRLVRLQFDDSQPLADHLFAIERELRDEPAGFEEMARLHFKAFLMLCCRHALRTGFVPVPSSPMESLRLYLDETYSEPHSLAALAKRARLQPTSLCRAFKAHTGKRVFDYLIERRIQAAMVALRGTDDKIVTIASDCGFHDLAYYNRQFKRIVGTTSSAYRMGGE